MTDSQILLKKLFLAIDKSRIFILDAQLRKEIIAELDLDETLLICHGLRDDTIDKFETIYEKMV